MRTHLPCGAWRDPLQDALHHRGTSPWMHLGFCPAQKLYEHAVGLRMQPTADFWQGFSHSVIEEKRGHEAFGCIAQCDPSVTAMTSLRIFQTAAKWWWQVENGLLVVFHGRIPDDFARFGVQGEHMTV